MLRDKSLIHKRGRCRKFGNHSLSGYCLIPQHATCEPGLGLFFSRFCKHSQRKWFHYDLLNLIFLWWLFVSSHGVDKWNTQGWEADRKKTNVFFFFCSSCFSNNNSTLCKRSILCRTSLLRGERKEGNRHYALSPVIHFCPVPSASHPSLCGWQVFSDETKTPPTCSVLLPSTKLTKKTQAAIRSCSESHPPECSGGLRSWRGSSHMWL